MSWHVRLYQLFITSHCTLSMDRHSRLKIWNTIPSLSLKLFSHLGMSGIFEYLCRFWGPILGVERTMGNVSIPHDARQGVRVYMRCQVKGMTRAARAMILYYFLYSLDNHAVSIYNKVANISIAKTRATSDTETTTTTTTTTTTPSASTTKRMKMMTMGWRSTNISTLLQWEMMHISKIDDKNHAAFIGWMM